MSISRRDVLKSLAVSAAATSVLRVIPAHAAEIAHQMIAAEKAAAPAKAYTPKFFSAHDYKTLQALCQTIIPADADSGGAIAAGGLTRLLTASITTSGRSPGMLCPLPSAAISRELEERFSASCCCCV